MSILKIADAVCNFGRCIFNLIFSPMRGRVSIVFRSSFQAMVSGDTDTIAFFKRYRIIRRYDHKEVIMVTIVISAMSATVSCWKFVAFEGYGMEKLRIFRIIRIRRYL